MTSYNRRAGGAEANEHADRLTALAEAANHGSFARSDGQDPIVLLGELGEPVPPYLKKLPPYLLWRRVEVVLAEQWPALDHHAAAR